MGDQPDRHDSPDTPARLVTYDGPPKRTVFQIGDRPTVQEHMAGMPNVDLLRDMETREPVGVVAFHYVFSALPDTPAPGLGEDVDWRIKLLNGLRNVADLLAGPQKVTNPGAPRREPKFDNWSLARTRLGVAIWFVEQQLQSTPPLQSRAPGIGGGE